jgi:hypothetical protein
VVKNSEVPNELHGVRIALAWEDATYSEIGVALIVSKVDHDRSCHFGSLVRLDAELPDHRFSVLCFGFDIAKFCDALEECHRTLKGCAEFVNQEGSIQLLVTVADAGRGQLAVGGQIDLPRGEAATVGLLPSPGMRFTFDGSCLEQSYVPNILQQLRGYLRDNGISTTHPMLAAHSPAR